MQGHQQEAELEEADQQAPLPPPMPLPLPQEADQQDAEQQSPLPLPLPSPQEADHEEAEQQSPLALPVPLPRTLWVAEQRVHVPPRGDEIPDHPLGGETCNVFPDGNVHPASGGTPRHCASDLAEPTLTVRAISRDQAFALCARSAARRISRSGRELGPRSATEHVWEATTRVDDTAITDRRRLLPAIPVTATHHIPTGEAGWCADTLNPN